MPRFLVLFVRATEAMNIRIGRIAMYLVFALAAVLMWSVLSKASFSIVQWMQGRPVFDPLWSVVDPARFRPALWTQEMAQFTMVGYFVLGGAYSLILGANVRMDLLYGRWSPKTQAAVDVVTIFALIFFLATVLWGGIESTIYALEVGERSRTVWRPYMAPIKIVICTGVFLMLLQSLCFLIRDIATLRGERI